ncbi:MULTISPECIES: ectoine/hydroxyectoine ABC transporter permease subunit EhuD [unclassified Variovorax]|uniref:ectoine/hydroxyectoine ABC transporter permease subunit EhuD n=1 Tax=unclassified Variovorax TaxID=663243 RepID=UPI003F45CE0F
MMLWDPQTAAEVLPRLMRGLVVTAQVTFFATILALCVGLFLAVVSRSSSSLVRRSAYGFMEAIRRTPLLIQLFFAFYVLPEVGVRLEPVVCGVLVLGLHIGCYMAEVYRAGIDGVNRGQWEAARALNFSTYRQWTAVVLPQAIPPMVPALGNYLIMMFKESALLSAIAVLDLMGEARVFSNESYRYVEAMTLVGAIYLAISIPSAVAVRYLEHKISRFNGSAG